MIMECDLRSIKKLDHTQVKVKMDGTNANEAVFDWHLIASSRSKYLPWDSSSNFGKVMINFVKTMFV